MQVVLCSLALETVKIIYTFLYMPLGGNRSIIFRQLTKISYCQCVLPAIVFQASLSEPQPWLFIQWETWGLAVYCSCSSVIWEMKTRQEFKPQPLTYTWVPQLQLFYAVGNYSSVVLFYLQRTLFCLPLVSSNSVEASESWHLDSLTSS